MARTSIKQFPSIAGDHSTKEDVMEIFENRPRVLHATLWRLWPPQYLLLSEQIEVRQSGDLHIVTLL